MLGAAACEIADGEGHCQDKEKLQLKVASLHRIVIGAGGFALLALAPLPTSPRATCRSPPRSAVNSREAARNGKRCKAKKFKDDEETYSLGYWMAKTGEYAEALDVLRSARDQSDPRIQTMIGFSLRKLGLVERGDGLSCGRCGRTRT